MSPRTTCCSTSPCDARLRRRLVEPLARRDDRRRARRGRALQARPDGLRAVEAVEAGRAGMAVAGGHHGAGPAGLAHRMLGDGVEASRRDLRHPRRRHRPGVSAPRERDRADRAAPSTRPVMANYLDAQRLPAGRRREDVEVARQFLHDPRAAGRIGRARCCVSACCKTHYRQPIDWTAKGCEESAKTLDDWYAVAADAESPAKPSAGRDRCAV